MVPIFIQRNSRSIILIKLVDVRDLPDGRSRGESERRKTCPREEEAEWVPARNLVSVTTSHPPVRETKGERLQGLCEEGKTPDVRGN